jgi:hypothetical protein
VHYDTLHFEAIALIDDTGRLLQNVILRYSNPYPPGPLSPYTEKGGEVHERTTQKPLSMYGEGLGRGQKGTSPVGQI